MKFANSFPQTPVCRRVRPTLLLPLLLCAAGLSVTAGAQTNQTRPVARLIASADHALNSTPTRPRAVLPGAVVGTAAGAANHAGPTSVAYTSADERRVFELINDARRARGQAPLVLDAELMRLARRHSENMARRSLLSHEDSDGGGIAERARSFNLRGWNTIAENIAYNQGYDDASGFAVERWLKSEKHRDNIMHAGFTHTGLGVARAADGSIYFTQVFVTR